MEVEYVKSYCELRIASQAFSLEQITRELGLTPDFSFCSTDSARSSQQEETKHNLWMIVSPTIISEERDITPHISYMRSKLKSKRNILLKYKKDQRLELIFTVRIETEDIVSGFSLSREDVLFINSICNRCEHFYTCEGDVITKK